MSWCHDVKMSWWHECKGGHQITIRIHNLVMKSVLPWVMRDVCYLVNGEVQLNVISWLPCEAAPQGSQLITLVQLWSSGSTWTPSVCGREPGGLARAGTRTMDKTMARARAGTMPCSLLAWISTPGVVEESPFSPYWGPLINTKESMRHWWHKVKMLQF